MTFFFGLNLSRWYAASVESQGFRKLLIKPGLVPHYIRSFDDVVCHTPLPLLNSFLMNVSTLMWKLEGFYYVDVYV